MFAQAIQSFIWVQTLGPPHNRTILSKTEENWSYTYMRISGTASAANLIPVVGMYVANNESSSEQRSVEVVFKNNVVSKCTLTSSVNAGSVNMMTGIRPTSQDAITKPCSL
jgi:hypothetical protein